jgi:antitoxin YefM
MERISFSAARTNPAKTMDQVCNHHAPVIITYKGQSAVMMSVEDYQALQETAWLLGHPNNARRLIDSIAELERGEGQVQQLEE